MQNNMIIAEIGSVHDGSFGNAINLIKLAAECGATAVKFQTHIAEAETIANAPSPTYFKSESRIDYFRRTSFTTCLLYTSPSPRDRQKSRMPSSA